MTSPINWTASTDNVGVAEYIIYRNSVEIGRVTDTAAVVPTPAPGSHWYQVRAIDVGDNESFKTPSLQIVIETPPEDDVTRPTAPQDLTGVIEANGDVTLKLDCVRPTTLRSSNTSCSATAAKSDRVADTTAVIPTPAPGSHWYQVLAIDAAGNESFRTSPVRIDI